MLQVTLHTTAEHTVLTDLPYAHEGPFALICEG